MFLANFFGEPRDILLVAGAGFDPRACVLPGHLNAITKSMRGLFIKENRPNPPLDQQNRADGNTATLLDMIKNREVVPVDIFGTDGAVVGGRRIIDILRRENLDDVTDVIVDISAMSVGTSFPIIRYFVEHLTQGGAEKNLHLLVAHSPDLDANIVSIPSDTPNYIHGFKGGSTLSESGDAARLWLPQLATGRRHALRRLYDFIEPHDTCPILPFPASNPRLGDELAVEYQAEIESTWSIDARDIVYADEEDPLDLYRTILRLDDLRRPVFAETGGSMLILSPLGSKVLALGALLAALERDLPVAHLEPIGYKVGPAVPTGIEQADLMHIWLEGDVYPKPRPMLSTQARTVP